MEKRVGKGKKMEIKDTRSGFGDGLTELGKKNNNIVALCADLTGSLKMGDFSKNHVLQTKSAVLSDLNAKSHVQNTKNTS